MKATATTCAARSSFPRSAWSPSASSFAIEPCFEESGFESQEARSLSEPRSVHCPASSVIPPTYFERFEDVDKFQSRSHARLRHGHLIEWRTSQSRYLRWHGAARFSW